MNRWLEWLERHCVLPWHSHLRYQCREACWRACHGASHLADPYDEPSDEPMPPEGLAWHAWLFRTCSVLGHNLHKRNLCRESREQAILGCRRLVFPPED